MDAAYLREPLNDSRVAKVDNAAIFPDLVDMKVCVSRYISALGARPYLHDYKPVTEKASPGRIS
jgi:hypothetical protein